MARETQPDEADLILSIARGLSHPKAAEETGMSLRTVQRRASEPEFRAAVAAARRAIVGAATGKLATASEGAIETLVGLLDSGSDSVRLGAARAVLENLLKYREAEELSDRVSQLEEAMRTAGMNGTPR